MAFQKGHKLSRGRPKGQKNSRTIEFEAVLARHRFCPASALYNVYMEAKEAMKTAGDKEALGYLKIMLDSASNICSYIYPKLKAVEYIKMSEWENFTLEEKFRMYKKLGEDLEEQKNAIVVS